MRKYATSWLIKVLLGAIVVVFVLWGVGSYKSQKEGRVAVVNGESVSLEEFKMVYSQMVEQLRQQLGNSLTDDLLGAFQVKRNAINQIVDRRLLMAEAERLNFRVSDAELSRAIRNISAFQTNGVFDARLYQNLLNLNRLTPEAFEIQQREAMLIGKLRTYIEGNIKISEPEVLEWFNWQNMSVNISYVLFEPEKYNKIQPSQDEITSFYNQRKNSYKSGPEIKVRYLSFKPDDYRDRVKIDVEELKSHYDSNPELYQLPKTVEARHILFRVTPDASAGAIESARLKAVEVQEKAKAGEDFAELAKRYSEGPSKDQGGYLGKFQQKDMVKPFADRAFSMKAGEISDPVRTQFGWHLIKVEAVSEETQLSFTDARDDISKKLVAEKAKTLAYDDAEASFNSSYDGGILSNAGGQNRKIKTTGFFDSQGPAEEDIKSPYQFAQASFKLELDEVSDIQDFEDGYYLLQVVEKKSERIPALEEIRERVVTDLTKEKQEEKARNDANEFLAALKKGDSIEQAAGRNSLTVKQSGYFKRNGTIPDIGNEQKVSVAAFELSEKNPLPEKIIDGDKGFYVIRYQGKKQPEPQEFSKNQLQTRTELLNRKKTKAFNEWMTRIREKSTIEIAEGYGE